MKHSLKVVVLLTLMFFVAQLIGISVITFYSSIQENTVTSNGTVINISQNQLPYGLEPPKETTPTSNLISILIAIVFSVLITLVLINFKADIILRYWFFLVVIVALAITLNSLLSNIPYAAIIALVLAIPLAIFKVFKRNLIVHNITELLIYPGIAALFVTLLNIWTVVLLLIFISVYDMYAVWHAGFMQKMAKYQIQKVKIFAGFFVPYLNPSQNKLIANKSKKQLNSKKLKFSVAILGGGDVVFPIILAGVVLIELGIIQALLISLFSTLALSVLFILSEKGKFYPAMPFITIGCFIGLVIAYLI